MSLDGTIRDQNFILQTSAVNYEPVTQSIASEDFYVLETVTGVIATAVGSSLPTKGSGGFAAGSRFYLSSGLTLGAVPLFINYGTATSCNFIPVLRQIGYGVKLMGNVASAGGDATETITAYNTDATFDIGFVGHAVSNDTDNILSTILTDNAITVVGSADPSTAHAYNWGVIRAGCLAEYDIIFAGTQASAGGSTAEAITLTGASANDFGFATYSATDDTDTIAKVVMTSNTMTITCSADPSTTHGFHYMVLRPRGTYQPSHYIAYAGLHTTVGGAAAEAVTITGALATDVPIVGYSVTNDTDTILKTVMTTNTMTVTCSADPSNAHQFWYLILRAY
jgi:hypothetical protein